jgi:NAD(P) transhydrogenase subunit alpha
LPTTNKHAEEISMSIGVPLETAARETRVAVGPDTAKTLQARGRRARVPSRPVAAARCSDEARVAVRAEVTDRAGAVGCGLVLEVRSPGADETSLTQSGRALARCSTHSTRTASVAWTAPG